MTPSREIQAILDRAEVTAWGCWIWRGAGHERGYGRVRWCGRVESVHRVIARAFLGEHFDSRSLVLHRCDDPRCINPAHLYLGTQADNMRDRIRRNRVPLADPSTVEQARDWIASYEAQIERLEARLARARSWLALRIDSADPGAPDDGQTRDSGPRGRRVLSGCPGPPTPRTGPAALRSGDR